MAQDLAGERERGNAVGTAEVLHLLLLEVEVLCLRVLRPIEQHEVSEAMGPVKLSDVEKAQQEIVNIAKRLESEGKIMISRGGEADALV